MSKNKGRQRKRGCWLTLPIGLILAVVGIAVLMLVAVLVTMPAFMMNSETASSMPPVGASATYITERYAGIEAPATVLPRQEFEISVGLFVDPISDIDEEVESEQAPLSLAFERPPPWFLEVELTAPEFGVEPGVRQSIRLELEGDSTQARFALLAPPDAFKYRVMASFWHEGTYLGEISRTIRVVSEMVIGAEPERTGGILSLAKAIPAPDLTVKLAGGLVTVIPSGYQSVTEPWRVSSDLEELLEETYSDIVARHARNAREVGSRPAYSAEERLRGLGRQLWDRYAPPLFKDAYWGLVDELGEDFRTILVISDQPMLPWELMIPVRADETDERLPLGLNHAVGRWYNGPRPSGISLVPQPPTAQELAAVAILAPNYQGNLLLPAQAREVDFILTNSSVPVHQFAGTSNDLRRLFASPPRGIIHFAGHGVSGNGGGHQISLLMEDGELPLAAFLGLRPTGRRRLEPQPFVFYNACDVGRAESLAGFAQGWAPTLLDLGAVGYIGTLWPVEDAVAADFAEEFYSVLGEQFISSGEADVARAVQMARQHTAAAGRGSATPYAYAFYGHPGLQLTERRKESLE